MNILPIVSNPEKRAAVLLPVKRASPTLARPLTTYKREGGEKRGRDGWVRIVNKNHRKGLDFSHKLPKTRPRTHHPSISPSLPHSLPPSLLAYHGSVVHLNNLEAAINLVTERQIHDRATKRRREGGRKGGVG